MAKLPKDVHKEIFKDICLNLLNCAEYGKICNPHWQLSCHAGLIVVSENTFQIEPYSEKMNEQLMNIAENHKYKAEIIHDNEDIYLEFSKI